MNRHHLVAVMALGLATRVASQEPRSPEIRPAVVPTQVAVQSRFVTGAPYSADAVSETTHSLADGNRIATKSVTRVYRDGEGRTRREQIGLETGAVQSVSISDPVAGASYTLDPVNRIAVRNSIMMTTPSGYGTGSGGRGGRAGGPAAVRTSPEELEKTRQPVETERAAGAGGAVLPRQAPPLPMTGLRGRGAGDNAQTTQEALGQQTVEGILATGTRTTRVIPAGAIGNLQPIRVISEEWMSPDLQVFVMTKHSDPRTGETIYRLSNIVRAEPDRSLFTVPPDYTLREPTIRREQRP
jgi:hypothetical protein